MTESRGSPRSACPVALLLAVLALAPPFGCARPSAPVESGSQPVSHVRRAPAEQARSAAATRAFWSLVPPRRPAVPAVSAAWLRNPVDAFILAGLEARGLKPAVAAERRTLIRRATLDLTGLPPTPEEVAAFEADGRPDAYERLVDRLLASPHHGERWARYWLDLARYADSGGYGNDNDRPHAWRWRDYVIAAFNADKPYDRFLLEQLAGDQLAPGDPEALTATGFCCNAPTIDNEQNEKVRLDELDDWLATTTSVFLGLTVGCARCHDHKFDPISQTDYYRLLAVFSNSVRRDLPVGAAAERRLAERLTRRHDEVSAEFAALVAPAEYGAGRWRTEGSELVQEGLAEDVRVYFGSPNWTDCTIEVEAQKVRGSAGFLVLARVPDYHNAFWFHAGRDAGRRHIIEREVDDRRTVISESSAGPATRIEPGRWYRLRLEARGPRFRFWVDDRLVAECCDDSHPRGRVGLGSSGTAVRYRKLVVRDRRGRVLFRGLPELDGGDLTAPLRRKDRLPRIQAVHRQLAEVDRQLAGLALAQCLVEDRGARPTYVLRRGEPRLRGEEVRPGVPAVLGCAPLPAGSGRRLALARWMARADNPLTARVIVNRLWQYHFGRGLVATSSDFGHNGSRPTHPELLDWLACELVQSGWSIKHIQRLILTANVYRQAARGEEGAERWLGRWPRRRLEAEVIRDRILAASGTLNRQMFGPGVKPRIDPGVLAGAPTATWPEVKKEGPEHWRRSVYVFVKRSVLHPLLEGFDLPAGMQSCERRLPTTVPTQALLLLNDPFIEEQAEAMADRLLREAGPARAGLVERAYWLALARPPTPRERRLGVVFLREQEEQHHDAGLAAPARAALADLCHVLFNLNEFVYVE
jgi:hypothetical protein